MKQLMQADKLRLIYKIGHKVRAAFDRLAMIGRFESNLEGACAIASFVLARELFKEGVNCKVIYGTWKSWPNEHCWVEVDDVLIVDITATQMGSKAKVKLAWYGSGYVKKETSRAFLPNDGFAWWYFLGWHREHQPTSENIWYVLKELSSVIIDDMDLAEEKLLTDVSKEEIL